MIKLSIIVSGIATNMDNNETEDILFTSESVGEGHPGDHDVAICKIWLSYSYYSIY